jgi:large subunit ribosomal protein L31e
MAEDNTQKGTSKTPVKKVEKNELARETVAKSKEGIKEKIEKTVKGATSSIKNPKKSTVKKVELERTYIVPLRKGFMKVPAYKRAKKALKTLKEFLAKHMKVENRDLSKVKIDIYLNNEIWFKGIKKPLSKVKVKVKKIDGIVYAELAEVPEAVKWKKQKNEKRIKKLDKKAMEKVKKTEKAEEEKKEGREDSADKIEEKEKEKSSVEAGLKKQEKAAKDLRHTSTTIPSKMDKMSSTTQRKALKK